MKADRNQLTDKRVVAYVRISNDGQDKGSNNQEGTINRYAERNGITILEWYKDNEGINPRGDGFDHPQFQRMYADAKQKKFNAVLCAYQERLGLIGHSFGYWVTELSKYGISLWDAQGQNLSNGDPATIEKTARDTIASQEWLIEHGIKMLNASISAGENGDYRGGVPPYYCDVVCYDANLARIKYRLVYDNRETKTQYLYNEDGAVMNTRTFTTTYTYNDMGKKVAHYDRPHKDFNDRLRLAPTMDERKLDITRRIFQWYNSESINFMQIAGRLNDMKIPAYYGGYWTPRGVKYLMLNPAIIGLPAQNKVTKAKQAQQYDDGHIGAQPEDVIGKKRAMETNQSADWCMPKEPIFPPIIEPSVFWTNYNKAQRTAVSGACKPSRTAEAWLKGFLYCAGCGCPMHFSNSGFRAKDKKTYRYVQSYRCGAYQRWGRYNPYGCPPIFIAADVMEELVEHYLTAIQERASLDSAIENGKSTIQIEAVPPCFDPVAPAVRQGLEAEIKALEQESDRLWDVAQRLGIPFAFEKAREEMKANEKRKAGLKAELKRLDEQITPQQYAKRVADARKIIKEGTGRAKKEALSKVLSRIDCWFGHSPNKTPRRPLVKVKFYPITLTYRDTDTPEERKRNNQIQAGIMAMGDKDGVKIEGHLTYDVEAKKQFSREEWDAFLAGKPVKVPLPVELQSLAVNCAKAG